MAMDVEEKLESGFPYWKAIRRRFAPDSPFFAPGNIERELLAKQYECLVEGCGFKFKNYKSRQQHLIDKHKFPTSFEFLKKARPSKKQRQKIQRKQATHKENDSRKMEMDNATMDGLVTAVSKLSTSDSTPSSVSFGRRHTPGLTFVPRAVQREVGSNSASPRRKQ